MKSKTVMPHNLFGPKASSEVMTNRLSNRITAGFKHNLTDE